MKCAQRWLCVDYDMLRAVGIIVRGSTHKATCF